VTYGNHNYEAKHRLRPALSRHAGKRAQQRGIDQSAVSLVLAYGKREFDGRGGVRYLMTRDSIDCLRRVVGTTQQVEALAGVYAVVSAEDDTVITLGHRQD
jgi:hypothetical protein